MSNAQIFQDHLDEINVGMERFEMDNGDTVFRSVESLKSGGSITMGVIFQSDESVVELRAWGLATINNPMKKEHLHELLNTLHREYRFGKFVEVEGEVNYNYSYFVDNGFTPYFAIQLYIMILETIEDVYPKFMKLQWA